MNKIDRVELGPGGLPIIRVRRTTTVQHDLAVGCLGHVNGAQAEPAAGDGLRRVGRRVVDREAAAAGLRVDRNTGRAPEEDTAVT